MPNRNEIGRISQRRYGGIFYEEFVKELQGKRGAEVYKEMSENDDTIGAMLFPIEMLIRQCDFHVEPAGKTEQDKRAAQFVEECMNDMQYTWTDTLSEILSFITYGWSYHEIVYKYRNGKKKDAGTSSKYNDHLIGWKKLPIRAQESLFEWKYNENTDDLLGMVQMPEPDYCTYFIPIEKALHFVTKSRKANPEGKSVLRNSYRSWYFKKRIQEIEGIGIERDLAGFPLLKAPEDVDIWDTEDPEMVAALTRAETIVTGIRRDEKEGLVLPNGWELELVSTGSRRQFDTNQIIERYDKRMAMTVMADFIFLGQQSVGSFALSSDKTRLFSMAVGTYLDIICEVFNNQGIPRLIDINGSAFDGITDYPKMVHGDVEEPDIQKLATYLKEMVGIGVIVPDEQLEDFVRTAGGLPERPEGQHRDYDMSQQGNAQQGNETPLDGELEQARSAEAQSVYKITSILEKYQKGSISRDIAGMMLGKIGCDDAEVNKYLTDADKNVSRMKQEKTIQNSQKQTDDEKDAAEAEEAKKSLGRS